MGQLTYDSITTINLEDRVLAHLQLVIGAKLRRNEAFQFSWFTGPDGRDGRETIWIHPAMPLWYKFFGARPPSINREWIDQLVLSANSPGGLVLNPEPDNPAEARP